MTANTVSLVLAILECFEAAKLPIWLFGGWAEEVWGISTPRMHHDIDLLYVAHTFDTLDQYIAHTSAFTEIRAKRFSHKRAILYQGVMVEFILVEPQIEGHRSHFFTDLYELAWPRDLLDYRLSIHAIEIPVASKAALTTYRHNHSHIEAAYQAYWLIQKSTTKHPE